MENVVRISANQAQFNSTNRLVDVVIPSNSGVYSLAGSYVAIQCNVEGLELDLTQAADGRLPDGDYVPAADAVADVRLGLKHNLSTATMYDTCAVPIETLVRNCSITSSTRGKIEDIRRSDTLRGTMKAYTNDVEDVETASLGGFSPMAKGNPWSSGQFAQLYGVGATKSGYRTHEIRIMLKDLFAIGQVEAMDTQTYGSLSVHMELNLNRLELQEPLGNNTIWGRYYHNQGTGATYPANIRYREALEVVVPIGAGISQDSIVMGAPYASLKDSPFFVNQMVKVTTSYTQPGGTTAAQSPADASVKWAVIKDIEWDKTTKLVTLGFGAGSAVFSCGVVATTPLQVNRDVEGMDVTAASKAAALSFSGVEIVAVRRTDVTSGPASIQYDQFQTQSDQWSNASRLERTYYLPANTSNAFIMMPSAQNSGKFSDILGCARLQSYRFTLNGIGVTNRVVPYMADASIDSGISDNKNDKGSSLHYTLISEAMMNSGRRFHSLNECVFDQAIPLSTDVPGTAGGVVGAQVGWLTLNEAPKKACYMISLPVPVSNVPTPLTIELNGSFYNESGEMHIFSEVRSMI